MSSVTRTLSISGFVVPAVLTLLGGCASPPPAPVESRGGVMVQAPDPGPDTPDLAAGGTEPSAATVIPLEPGAAAPADMTAHPAPRPSTELRESPAPAARPASPAVVALLNRANDQRRSGQHAGAASSLERAIKIEPGNPWLWHRLAVTRFDQGRAGEAASLAAKSNSLAAADPELQAENWRLIARVHRARGENVAAQAAEERARRLSRPRT